jgi:hypothetical protein
MAKIFYCGGLSGRMGTLRAVILLVDLFTVLREEIPIYAGPSFPELEEDSGPCIVIELMLDEETAEWKAGFYLLGKEPVHFEDGLRTLSTEEGRIQGVANARRGQSGDSIAVRSLNKRLK